MTHSTPLTKLLSSTLTLAVLGALALGLAACSPSTGLGAGDINCDAASPVTYDNFGAAFMSVNCTGCHGAGSRTDTSSLASIRANAAGIIDQTVYNVSMPQDSSLTDAERIELGKWLNCGAP